MSTKSRSKKGGQAESSTPTGSRKKGVSKRAVAPVQTTAAASSPSDSFTSPDESELSPISPPVASQARVNKWAHDPKRRRFKLLRSFTLADFVTLGNAACGTCSIFFCLNYLENNQYDPYILASFVLLPLALLFDICDGFVARARQNSSPYGSDLDSLADVISFSVAPAVLAFTLGMRGVWDCIILAFFVCAGVSRLARYNVTAETLEDAKTGKVKYYQGFPVPTSLALVMLLAIAYSQDGVLDKLWGGSYRWSFPSTLPGAFHPFSLLFGFFGCAMMSEWKIPKP